MKNYTREEAIYDSYGEAFLASKAKSLYDLIVQQGAQLLIDLGAHTPSNCTSIILLLECYDSLSTVEIAHKLNKSHQLISQRINRLETLNLIHRSVSDSDRRAKVISLTELGLEDVEKVKQACHVADHHFQALYREINLNVGESIDQMKDKLTHTPLKNTAR